MTLPPSVLPASSVSSALSLYVARASLTGPGGMSQKLRVGKPEWSTLFKESPTEN
jgi:hypothetical protein